MNSNANSQNGNAVPVWPSMDSIMPPNVGSSDSQPSSPVSPVQQHNGQQVSQPVQIEDNRHPGAPPLPVAGPTPNPNSTPGMLKATPSSGGRPGERAAAIAARAEAAASQPVNEISQNGWGQQGEPEPRNGSNNEASQENVYHLRPDDENLVAMPDLNKVKLPHSTAVGEKSTESSKQTVMPAKPIKAVEPEVARPLAAEPDVSPARMETSKTEEVAEPKPEPVKEAFTNSTQLALQVIFGFEGDLSRQEVLDLAKDLEGIREVKLVGGAEAAAMKVLRESAEEFEFGGESGLILRSDGYPVEFVGDEKVCLCVILEQPELPKGTLEKLTLIAREAARLG